MRLPLCFCLLFIASVHLAAQTYRTPFNGRQGSPAAKWTVSLEFAPQLNPNVALRGLQLEVAPDEVDNFPPGFIDTVDVSGTERYFRFDPDVTYQILPSHRSFAYGAAVRFHYSLRKDLQLVVGGRYGTRERTTLNAEPERPVTVSGTETFLIYPVSYEKIEYGGLTSHLEYHLLSSSKLHPFFGAGVNLLLHRTGRQALGSVYSGTGQFVNFVGDTTVIQNTTFDFDFSFTGGLLYRFLPRWDTGLTLTTRTNPGTSVLGWQLRYRL